MTIRDILKLMNRATVWSWHRDSQSLSVFVDDLPKDRRSVYWFSLPSLNYTLRTLRGYDASRHMWSEYCAPDDHGRMPSRHGQKALLSAIRAQSLATSGLPNSEAVHYYAKQ